MGKSQNNRSEASLRIRENFTSLTLLGPAILFLLALFVWPISTYLFRSVDNSEIANALPNTFVVLEGWDGKSNPPDEAFGKLYGDLSVLRKNQTIGNVARLLNYREPGFREMILKAARTAVDTTDNASVREAIVTAEPRWQDVKYWRQIKQAAGSLTSFFALASIDLTRTDTGDIVAAPEEQRLFLSIYVRTLTIAALVTFFCLVLGYPTAYILSAAGPGTANLLMLLLMIPFWTSLLVRTISWVVILQDGGPVNSFLLWLGVIDEPLHLLYSRFAVVVAMTQVLLPFMVLPLYATMKAVSPAQVRAAMSLGGGPVFSFRTVYLPQTRPGISAGCLLVFILALGYYITPAIVGGPADQMLSQYIAFYTNQTINWGLASALSVGLLLISLVLFVAYARVVNMKNMRLS